MEKFDLFLSYSSKDDEVFEFCKNLESNGLRCWIAPRDIVPGVPYARAIMQGLNGADTVVVFISSNSLLSEDVLNEVDNAHGLKKNIIPVFIEKVDLTPEFSYYLKRKQWINAYNAKDEAIAQIHRAIGKPPVAPSKDIIDASISNQKNENKEIYYDIILTDIGQSNIFLGEVVAFKNVFGGSLSHIKNFLDEHRNGSIHLATLSDKEEIEIIRQAFLEYKGKIECRLSSATEPYRIKPPKKEISQNTNPKDTEEEILKQLFHLGSIYYNKKDYSKAKQYFRMVVEQGDPNGAFCLADIYRVEQNYSEALKWHRMAAEQGITYSYKGLGDMYYEGLGVKKDLTKAIEWYKKASDYSKAQFNLGRIYYKSDGSYKDNQEALEWFTKAAKQGHSEAKRYVEIINGKKSKFQKTMDNIFSKKGS